MVNEFTELQGVMGGRKYAEIFGGEDDIVAQAIEEHYMPRNAHDEMPHSIVGSIVSIADKIDTIVGCFSVALIPSGSQDPYALRRQTLGILQIIQHHQLDINVMDITQKVFLIFEKNNIPTAEKSEVLEQLESFFKQRAAYIMKEANIESDIIEAVLVNTLTDFSFIFEKAKTLKQKKADSNFKEKQEGYVRVLNLAAKAKDSQKVDVSLFINEEEASLNQAYLQVKNKYNEAITNKDAAAIEILTPLVDPIHRFFDHTMVMDKDEKIRHNRLALLQLIAEDVKKYADLTKVQWKQSKA